MITVELEEEDEGRVFIHADRAGLLKLAALLTELAASTDNDHLHLMSPEHGGTVLSAAPQDPRATLVHHLQVHLWT